MRQSLELRLSTSLLIQLNYLVSISAQLCVNMRLTYSFCSIDVGTWRSDTEDGNYQGEQLNFPFFSCSRNSSFLVLSRLAYSNASDAAVTFSFIGVGVAYLAEKKADRGLCQLTVDGKDYYTVDLYNDSGYSQGIQLVWDSGTLVYGMHNVTISQIGPDARFG